MNPFFRRIVKAFSRLPLDIRKNYDKVRKLNKIAKPTLKQYLHGLDHELKTPEGRSIPVRIYEPCQSVELAKLTARNEITPTVVSDVVDCAPNPGIILFIHGGGWVIGDIDTYHATTALLAQTSGRLVISVDYRLAPEHPFPAGLDDCLLAYRTLRARAATFGIDPHEISLMGDSAGGNLCAALCLLLKELGEPLPRRQILLYPATGWNYTDDSEFPSVKEKGYDYGLTAAHIRDYMSLYCPDPVRRRSPLVAPILAEDLSGMPETFIFTCEHDPLRDEGEAYGQRLSEAGVPCKVWRVKDALHGYFSGPLIAPHVASTYITLAEAMNDRPSEALLDSYKPELISPILVR